MSGCPSVTDSDVKTYLLICNIHFQYFRGLNEFLIHLIFLKEKGVTIALMTNDTQPGVEEFIFRNKLEGFFDYFWSAENKPSKPKPEAVIELCKTMNLNPSECALISDADTDLRMAKKADIQIVVGFNGGWKTPPTLNEKRFLIEKLNELKIHSSH